MNEEMIRVLEVILGDMLEFQFTEDEAEALTQAIEMAKGYDKALADNFEKGRRVEIEGKIKGAGDGE